MDGDGGRLLLRVLLMMTMSKHPNLVSQALKLVISHFSQREEMVSGFRKVKEVGRDGEEEGRGLVAFLEGVVVRSTNGALLLSGCLLITQVQLLVSPEDRKNYQTITETLNKLKLLVEEAELWVMKQLPRVEDTGGKVTAFSAMHTRMAHCHWLILGSLGGYQDMPFFHWLILGYHRDTSFSIGQSWQRPFPLANPGSALFHWLIPGYHWDTSFSIG